MAIISPHPDSDNRNLHYAVYIKTPWTGGWSGQWQYAPYFEPITATLAAAPTISTATFRMRYGSGKWEDMQEMIDGSLMQSYLYCYIQIRIRRGEDEIILWTGIIPTETFALLGQSGLVKTADQTIQAQGLEILLKNRLDGAWIKRGEGDVVWIDHVPAFNQRHEYGGNIIGNKSNSIETVPTLPGEPEEEDTYIFSTDNEVWYNFEIAEYLLAHYNYQNGPEFFLVGEEAIISALYDIIGVYDFSSVTVYDALNILISRGRGFGWSIEVMPDGDVYIVPFSLLDEDIILGDIIMPANPNKMSVDLWTEQEHIDVQITGSITNLYDRIVVQGARMKSCCSLCFGLSPPGLEKGWSNNEETAFKNAAKESAGYGSLNNDDKAARNDKFRAEDRFERVFTTFRIPHNWDWTVGGEIVNPGLDTMGELLLNTPSTYWNADKRFLNSLPFKVGVDYSGAEPVDNNPADSEPVFKRPFILVKDVDGNYQYAEKLKPYGAPNGPLPREMGISMRFNPQYLSAKNHWTSAEPGEFEDDIADIGVDYEDIEITVFLETDQVVQVVHVFNRFENQRTLIITIPDAELWYITPGTIIGVDENGASIVYGGTSNLLRDDRERLRIALNSAKVWYGRERNKIAITIKTIDPGIPIGTLVENVDIADVGAIGSVVTELHWDFQNRSTAIMTDFGELDIAGIYSQRLSRNKPIAIHA